MLRVVKPDEAYEIQFQEMMSELDKEYICLEMLFARNLKNEF